MVIAHHLIWTVYGWWLPNDPRGSSSREIRVQKIANLSDIHYGRKTKQPSSKELKSFHADAQSRLAHEVLLFNDSDFALIGKTIGETIRNNGYTCYAAAVLPEHIHLLIRRHRDHAEVMLENFQQATSEALVTAGIRNQWHPIWGGSGWKVFQSSAEDILRTITYIRENPIKAGRPEQFWEFVTPYDGWEPPPVRRDGRF